VTELQTENKSELVTHTAGSLALCLLFFQRRAKRGVCKVRDSD